MTLGAIAWAIAALLSVVGVAIVGVLCTPLRVSAEFDTGAKPAFLVKVAVLGGLLPVVSTAARRPEAHAKKTQRRAAPKSRKSSRLNFVAYAPRMLRAGPRLISAIAARVKFEAIDASVSFGLADPADTGIIYGVLAPLVHVVGTAEHSHVTLQPDFNNVIFNGRGRIAARFTPLALLPSMLRFGWTAFVSPRLSGGIR